MIALDELLPVGDIACLFNGRCRLPHTQEGEEGPSLWGGRGRYYEWKGQFEDNMPPYLPHLRSVRFGSKPGNPWDAEVASTGFAQGQWDEWTASVNTFRDEGGLSGVSVSFVPCLYAGFTRAAKNIADDGYAPAGS